MINHKKLKTSLFLEGRVWRSGIDSIPFDDPKGNVEFLAWLGLTGERNIEIDEVIADIIHH